MGWNGSDKVRGEVRGECPPSAPIRARCGKRKRVAILASACIVTCVVGVLMWVISPSSVIPSTQNRQTSRRIADKTPSHTASVTNISRRIEVAKGADPRLGKALEAINAKIEPIPISRTAKPFKLPPPTKISPAIQNGIDQRLSFITGVVPGDMPMPLFEFDEDDLKELVPALLAKNEVKDDDDADTAELKRDIAFAKKELMTYIRQGGDPNEFMEYYTKQLTQCFEMRCEAISQADDLFHSEPELFNDFVKAVNKKFEEEGIRTISRFDITGDPEDDPDAAKREEKPQD